MERVVRLTAEERAELFSVAAGRKKTTPAVIEKDFWVCWVLARLFNDMTMSKRILFKGGTSLSKVFGLIERFSEDVDLILDWAEVTQEDPNAERSRSKQERFKQEVMAASETYLREVFLPDVQRLVGDVCRAQIRDNPEVIQVEYPVAFEDKYLRPVIQLEVGPMAAWMPNERRSVRSYLAEVLPDEVVDAEVTVSVIKAERTFWEKVTILHSEAHRPDTSQQPRGYSRHYYDVYRMVQDSVKRRAFEDIDLLHAVAIFKDRFYYRAWARYDLAKPGTVRLVPPDKVLQAVSRDYDEMRVMIFGERPDFGDMMGKLSELEAEINAL